MSKISSFEEIVIKARKVHGDTYTYLSLDRTTKKPQLKILCSKHGEFSQQLSNHLSGKGCLKCSVERTGRSMRHTLESVREIGNKLHNSKYAYTALERVSLAPMLTLSCNKHGEFQQEMYAHLAGKGCIKCAFKFELIDILNKAHEVHSSRYDYVGYVEDTEVLKVYCKKHGVFRQSRASHLAGYGCSECGREEAGLKARLTLAEVQARAPDGVRVWKVGREDFDRGSLTFVKANCDVHGEFRKGSDAIQNGCPKCAYMAKAILASTTLEEYTDKACKVHNSLYGYLALDRSKTYPKVVAVCRLHGVFLQGMANHLQGDRCPICASTLSLSSNNFVGWVKSICPDTAFEVRLGESRLRWDAVVLNKNVAFEFHGLYWHSDEHKPASYHYNKHQQGLDAGFRTIHIFEDEWLLRPQAVKSLVRMSLGLVTEKVYARQCHVLEISSAVGISFLEQWHIQGKPSASRYLGIHQGNRLVAVIAYANRASGRGHGYDASQVEVTRFASSTQVVGGFSKALAYMQKTNPELKAIYTFSDTRVFSGSMYAACGFTPVAKLKPDYFYVRHGKRQHKATLQKSNFKSNPKLLYEATLTESQLAKLNGFFKVYDCGKIKWQKLLD
jgi:hypothetical protein